MKTVEQFFNDYAIASLNGKANEIATFYAQDFIAVSQNQSSTFKNDKKFIEWLNEVFEFNKRSGLKEMIHCVLHKHFCHKATKTQRRGKRKKTK